MTPCSPQDLRRLLAFYLPQFHPVAENNEWWGAGFTEWTNVVKARPQFQDHYQPHLPKDLGFYDLRLPETREAQADLAREHGIHGFCYYHYWFNGRRLLDRPFAEVLTSKRPDFPFCLCWANENWTRVWDGSDRQVLLQQEYHDDDDRRHLRALLPAFRDERYIRIDGKPVFLVYRLSQLPDPRRTANTWNDEARKHGLEGVFLLRVESFQTEVGDPALIGFDGAVEFQPAWSALPHPLGRGRGQRLAALFGGSAVGYQKHRVFDYGTVVNRMLGRPPAPYLRFPCVTPMWDNTSRRKEDAVILHGSTPELYEHWLTETLRKFDPPSVEKNLIFVNAWNEWGEGNHLEPCQRWGRAYLDATRRAVARTSMARSSSEREAFLAAGARSAGVTTTLSH